jgi:hypothetical protein
MSGPFSYTFYSPFSSQVAFPISNETLPAPQSQKYIKTQYTGQIQSTPDSSTALGLGTSSVIDTLIFDQQGQLNEIIESLFNMNGLETGDPPKGVLACVVSQLNTSEFIPEQDTIVVKGLVNTAYCNGAYFGAVGTCNFTYYSDARPAKIDVKYTLPPPL